MLSWLRERITELREGLEEIQAQAQAQSQSSSGQDGNRQPRRPGLRRHAPVHLSADDDPWEPPEESALESLDLDLEVGAGIVVAAPRPEVRPREGIRARLRDPARMREAIVLREILDPPLALRRPVRRSFRDR